MSKALVYELGKSISFGRLSLLGKVLWPMLLAASDDQGRGVADPDVVKWFVCPNVPEITLAHLPAILDEMITQDMICVYRDVRGRSLYQVVHWWEYQQLQWAQPSRYQPPMGWVDRVRTQRRGNGYQEENWNTPGGFFMKGELVGANENGNGDNGTGLPPENQAPEPSENVESPGGVPGGNPGGATTQLNSTQPNLTQDNTSGACAPSEAILQPADQETAEWIADLEAETPPENHPPHSADEYREQLRITEARMYARIAGEPWAAWGEESRAIQRWGREDVPRDVIKRIGYCLEQHGLKPAWGSTSDIKSWLAGIVQLYQVADGNADLVIAAIDQAIRENRAKPKERQLSLTSPHSFCFAVRQIVAARTTQSPTSADPVEQQMKDDPQLAVFRRLREEREKRQ